MLLKSNDLIVNFGFENIGVRGKFVKINNIVKTILKRFNNRDEINNIFIESIILNSILASNFKFDGAFKFQLNCYGGVIKVVLCNNTTEGNVNGYISIDENILKDYDNNTIIPFQKLIGEGYIMFHLDQKLAKPYQAIVAIEGDDLSQSANNWFLTSEQTPTYVRLVTEKDYACGIFLQVMPTNGLNEIEKMFAQEDFNNIKALAENISKNELLYDNVSSLLHKMYGSQGLIIRDSKKLQYKCHCNKENVAKMVANLGTKEIESIREENNGKVEVDCAFCGTKYEF